MKKTNEIITTAIYAIIFAYNCCCDNFGFDLHIEDHAPNDAKVAGLDDEARKQIEEDDLPLFVKQKLGLAALQQAQLAGACCNKEQAKKLGYFIGDHIVIFYETLISMANNESDLYWLAFEFVCHELRHAEQFVWLRNHGIDPTDAMMQEAKYQYGTGPLEKDAWAIQKGATTPIEEAMASFLK